MTTNFVDTIFKVGYLYLVGNKYLICSRTINSNRHYESHFRSFPDCTYYDLSRHGVRYTETTVIAHNVPFSRHTRKGRERIRKWQEVHPELFI